MINGLLLVIGIIGVTKYFGEPDALELFGVKFHVGHWDSDLDYWTHQDSNLAQSGVIRTQIWLTNGFWGSSGVIKTQIRLGSSGLIRIHIWFIRLVRGHQD